MNTVIITFLLALAGAPEPVEPEPVNSSGIKEEITVQASKTETPMDQFGNVVSVVTSTDIAKHQWRTVAQALHFMPGVSMASTGGAGGITNIFLRGAKPEDTLVLINGVKMNDASGTGRGYDFAHLSTAGIERIELILGPQSTLYGSDASAGVVNIIMQEGAEPRYNISLESSFEDNKRGSFSLGGRTGLMTYAAGVELIDSRDLSASALQPFGSQEPLEEDGYENGNGYLSLGFELGEYRRLNFGVVYLDTSADIDSFDSDDPNFISDYRQNAINLSFEDRPGGGIWGYSLHLNRSQTDRDTINEVDTYHPADSSTGEFQGVNTGAEFRNSLHFSENIRLVTGLTLNREEADGLSAGESAFGPFESNFSEEADLFGVFAQTQISLDSGFHATLGGRYDDHSQFGSESTWQAALGYRIEATGTRLRGFYGTGYRAPSIYQLYSDFGNIDLREETSATWEVGVTQEFLDGALQMGLTWFEGDYENLIDFGFDAATNFFGYINLADETRTEGLEAFVSYSSKVINVRLSYEDLSADQLGLDFEGNPTETPLLRRFDDKASLLLSGRVFEHLDWNLDVLDYGETVDNDFIVTFLPVTLEGYTLVNLGLSYHLGDHMTFQARALNLTDEEYTTVFGYSSYGSRVFVSFQYDF